MGESLTSGWTRTDPSLEHPENRCLRSIPFYDTKHDRSIEWYQQRTGQTTEYLAIYRLPAPPEEQQDVTDEIFGRGRDEETAMMALGHAVADRINVLARKEEELTPRQRHHLSHLKAILERKQTIVSK